MGRDTRGKKTTLVGVQGLINFINWNHLSSPVPPFATSALSTWEGLPPTPPSACWPRDRRCGSCIPSPPAHSAELLAGLERLLQPAAHPCQRCLAWSVMFYRGMAIHVSGDKASCLKSWPKWSRGCSTIDLHSLRLCWQAWFLTAVFSLDSFSCSLSK